MNIPLKGWQLHMILIFSLISCDLDMSVYISPHNFTYAHYIHLILVPWDISSHSLIKITTPFPFPLVQMARTVSHSNDLAQSLFSFLVSSTSHYYSSFAVSLYMDIYTPLCLSQ